MDATLLLAAAVLLAVLVAGLAAAAVLVVSGLRRTNAGLAVLARRLEEVSAAVAAPSTPARDAARRPGEADRDEAAGARFLITSLPDATRPAPPEPVPAARFVTVAAGESLVRLLSLGYGVRRALSPENRNRIRFEMRREVRRSRRRRRDEVREARRLLRARQAGVAENDAA